MGATHATPGDLATLLAPDPLPGLDWLDRLHLVGRHLSEGCRPCWDAVGSLMPKEARWGPTREPVVAALRRLYLPGSWPGLDADHFAAARAAAAARPLGFAALVVEEAWRLSVSGHWWITEPLAAASYLVDQLGADPLNAPAAASLRAKIAAYAARVRASRGETFAAQALLGEAAGHLVRGGHDPRTEAACFETEAQLALCGGDPRKVRRLLLEALGVLGEDHALRRFELRRSIAEILLLGLPPRRFLLGPFRWYVTREIAREIAAMLDELAAPALAADPAWRAWALYRQASAAAHLLGRAAEAKVGAGRLRLPDVGAALAAEDKVFSAAVDPQVKGRALFYVARCYELSGRPGASTRAAAEHAEHAYRSALELFAAANAEPLYLKAWQALNALYARAGRRDKVAELDAELERRAIRSLPGVRERLEENLS